MRPCSGTVFDDQPVERPHIRRLSGVATRLRHLVDIPFPTDKPVEGARVKTFFKTLKAELVWRTVFYTRDQAATAIARYIDGFYNPVRRHSALNYISPAQFERTASR